MAKPFPSSPTPETYDALQRAYDHFNRDLFGGTLPSCLITLQRQRGAYGYFSGDRFQASKGKPATADEIAMNPTHMGARSDTQTLSTLAHEMVHLWQHHHGTPGRRGYHNAEWAAKMKTVGLTPTSTGEPGGKETGERVTHMIVKGGPFARSCKTLLAAGLVLRWHHPYTDADKPKKPTNTRAKYSCPDCGLNAWAKPSANLMCGDCETSMEEDVADTG